jgi:hypothetical protein
MPEMLASFITTWICKSYPQMGRYTFKEKMEYWAFLWGGVMGATGFWRESHHRHNILPGELFAAKAAWR